MPLDAICLRALTNELKGQLLGARIDKVQQPARDQIVLLLRGNLRLLLNAGPNQPRVQLTEVLRENPAEPPMLCMLLRKHLVGGRITEIEQSGLERIVTFTVRSVNELGESGTKKLVLEAMGRRSNLLLLDEPTNGLDPIGIEELRDQIRGFAAAGTTVIVSSHILSEGQQMADTIGIIYGGRLAYEDALRPGQDLEELFMSFCREGRRARGEVAA